MAFNPETPNVFEWGLTEGRLKKAMESHTEPQAPCRHCHNTSILGIDGLCQTCADAMGLLNEEVDIRSRAKARGN